MAHGLDSVVANIRRLAGVPQARALDDRQLLERFAAGDEAAFTVLVDRYGGLVMGVCRRVLRHIQDAEDAFQATFLVLARKADKVAWQVSVANWLHGVAYRVSVRIRSEKARRLAREGQSLGMENGQCTLPGTDKNVHPTQDLTWSDLKPVLDEELDRLPAKLRVPLILCCLEGKTRDEAAQQLGWSLGSVKGRLERGRELLRRRLARRGLALSAVLSATLLAAPASKAAVPITLGLATVRAGMNVLADPTAGVVSPQILNLAQGAVNAMFMTKLKCAAAVLLTFGALTFGTGYVAHQVLARPTAAQSTPAETVMTQARLADFEQGNFLAVEEFAVTKELLGERNAGGDNDRKPPTLGGRVVSVGKDGKSLVVETPGKGGRGNDPVEEAKKHDVKIARDTQILFFGVGPDGAKLIEGQHARVWFAEGSKDVAAKLQLMGGGDRQGPDVAGRVVSVGKDGKAISFQVPPKVRGEEPTTTEIQLTDKTAITYSFVAKGAAKPTEGYHAEVWLARGSKVSAAKVHFGGGAVTRGERGTPDIRPESSGKVVAVADDGKAVTLETPGANRGDEPVKVAVKIDAKTQLSFSNISADGDRPAMGYLAQAWLAEGSKDTAAKLHFMAPVKDASVRGKVVSIAKEFKGVTLEMPAKERGAEPPKMEIKISAETKLIFNGVGPGEARISDGHLAQVWLEDGSTDTAAVIVFGRQMERGR